MRGRFTAAIWLYVALFVALAAIGQRAPRPQASNQTQRIRARLQLRAAEGAPIKEDASLNPEGGCLLDRSTGQVYTQSLDGVTTSLAKHALEGSLGPTACADAADPSAQEYALAQLAQQLREKWREQGDLADQAQIVYVASEATQERTLFWERFYLPDLATAADDAYRALLWLGELLAELPTGSSLNVSAQSPNLESEVGGLETSREPTSSSDANEDLAPEREEVSILIRRDGKSPLVNADRFEEVADREEVSILLVR